MSDPQKGAQAVEGEGTETLREAFVKAVAGKPRFKESSKAGRVVVIVGHPPPSRTKP
jgi:hypothetical protein